MDYLVTGDKNGQLQYQAALMPDGNAISKKCWDVEGKDNSNM